MDRRREPRFPTHQQASVTVLGEQPTRLTGYVENMSGRGARLVLETDLPLNAAVRVDLNDAVLLGEVCYRDREGDHFAVGLVFDQVLHKPPELLPLLRALQDSDRVPVASGVTNKPASVE